MTASPSNARRGPLSGVRVCDFTWIIAGPQATRIFADLGAEVIKVENSSYLDAVRGAPGLHNNFNRNKLGITANLHHPLGREVVERLISRSDIVIENFSSGAFSRMGFPYERLRELREDIIYISLSGFGQTGRDSSHVTWGPTAQGISGLTAMSGYDGIEPAGWGYSYLDHTAGFYAAISGLLALWQRTESGEGRHIDMAQVESGIFLAGVELLNSQVNGQQYARVGNHSRDVAPHSIYPCMTADTWVAIATESEDEWHSLCSALELGSLLEDARFSNADTRLANQDALDDLLAARTREFEAHSLVELLQTWNVPAGVCQTIQDRMENDPQLNARGFYSSAEHGELGMHRFEGFPVKFSRNQCEIAFGAPVVGEHSDYVLETLLGYSTDEIASMKEEAAV